MQSPYNFMALDREDALDILDRDSPISEFNKVVGQHAAVNDLIPLCAEGLANDQHEVAENVILLGDASLGKSFLSRRVAAQLGVVFKELDCSKISNTDQVGKAILEAWAEQREVLETDRRSGDTLYYSVPPMVLFLDETQELAASDAQGGMLKALERSDGMLFCKGAVFDCKKILFIGATTDFYDLGSAFRSRFDAYKIKMVPYTEDEAAEIVLRNFETWNDADAKELVKWFGRIPRVLLGYARRTERRARTHAQTLVEAIKAVVKDEGIDNWGMRREQVGILKALYSKSPKGMMLRHLLPYANTNSANEVIKGHMPPLLMAGYVTYDNGKYFIETSGVDELKKRGLA